MPELTARPTRGDPIVMDFTFIAERGLFAAAWLEGTDPTELTQVEALWDRLTRPDDPAKAARSVRGGLLGVRTHCLRAAAAGEPATARSHYRRALDQCEELMQWLHHAEAGEEAALAEWTAGVHGLIRAQLAMPDIVQARELALAALDRLLGVQQPGYPGVLEDARAARTLAEEPGECATRLHDLPTRVLDGLNEARYRLESHVSVLNLRLANVREQHSRGFQATVAWGALNLALLATLPLNGIYYETVPWSLPFLLALPVVWWWTWSQPYRDGLRFFDWIRSASRRSLVEFKEAATAEPDWAALFAQMTDPLLERGRQDLLRLNALSLMPTPDAVGRKHLLEAERTAARGRTILRSICMADMDDSHPVPVAELVPTEPSRLPHATRIYLDPA